MKTLKYISEQCGDIEINREDVSTTEGSSWSEGSSSSTSQGTSTSHSKSTGKTDGRSKGYAPRHVENPIDGASNKAQAMLGNFVDTGASLGTSSGTSEGSGTSESTSSGYSSSSGGSSSSSTRTERKISALIRPDEVKHLLDPEKTPALSICFIGSERPMLFQKNNYDQMKAMAGYWSPLEGHTVPAPWHEIQANLFADELEIKTVQALDLNQRLDSAYRREDRYKKLRTSLEDALDKEKKQAKSLSSEIVVLTEKARLATRKRQDQLFWMYAVPVISAFCVYGVYAWASDTINGYKTRYPDIIGTPAPAELQARFDALEIDIRSFERPVLNLQREPYGREYLLGGYISNPLNTESPRVMANIRIQECQGDDCTNVYNDQIGLGTVPANSTKPIENRKFDIDEYPQRSGYTYDREVTYTLSTQQRR